MFKVNEIKRYTTLAATIDLLVEERLALLDPSTWKDKNDVRFLQTYSSKLDLKSLCAACFTQKTETYHHWDVFAGDGEGVCIELDKEALLASLSEDASYMWDDVKYYSLVKMRNLTEIDLYKMPFMKRQGFGDEKEFRIVWQSKNEETKIHYIPIKRIWIKRIVLNPWLNEGLFPSIKSALRSIPGCEKIKVSKTSLIDNREWKEACERVDDFAALLGPPPRSV